MEGQNSLRNEKIIIAGHRLVVYTLTWFTHMHRQLTEMVDPVLIFAVRFSERVPTEEAGSKFRSSSLNEGAMAGVNNPSSI